MIEIIPVREVIEFLETRIALRERDLEKERNREDGGDMLVMANLHNRKLELMETQMQFIEIYGDGNGSNLRNGNGS